MNAENDNDKQKAIQEHLLSVRKQIDELSNKQYEELKKINSLDYVLMFIPIESAFLSALEKDADIFKYGYDKKIIIVCPSTLMVTLRTIENMWKHEYRSQNAQEIALEAGRMYDRFVDFVKHMDELHKYLDKSVKAYDEAYNTLKEGKGNLINRAEKLRLLGAKNKKQMDAELIESAGPIEIENMNQAIGEEIALEEVTEL